ncbi:MFS transporter [Niallia circulans]|uniref:MFS transporter n=1 Tax=Niallia circulans TaxID=1397 RepID=UPI000BA69CFD|nr:MFS transporter [Niallia circulans]PAD24197.1 MFS transporter [Niallia circulans]
MKLNKNFTLLLNGQSFANIGDVLYMVSIINLIYTVKGSATAASFVPFTITTSMFISSILTPLFVRKIRLNRLLAGSQMGKTGLLLLLGFILPGITEANYFIIFMIIGLIAFLDGCANPITRTLIPYYVRPEKLMKANGMVETVTQLIQAGMWFVGSLFLLFLSPQNLIWFVCCLFFVSSCLLCLLENVDGKTIESAGKLEQIKAGWKTLFHTPVLRKMALVESLESLAGTVWIAAVLYVFIQDALKVDQQWWGFMNGTFFLGLILGSLYCMNYSSFVERKLGAFLAAGSFISFLLTILFSLNSIPILALGISFGVGIVTQIKSIPQQTVIQTSVPKEQLSTVYTSFGAIGTGIFGIGSLLMGLLADLLGVRIVFLFSGVLLALVSMIIYKNKSLFRIQSHLEKE